MVSLARREPSEPGCALTFRLGYDILRQTMPDDLTSPSVYEDLLKGLVDRIRAAQARAALAVNRELVALYWEIGREIVSRQDTQGWGAKVIDRLAADLRRAFPGSRGFSARNLKYMRALATAWPDQAIVQQLLHKFYLESTNEAINFCIFSLFFYSFSC